MGNNPQFSELDQSVLHDVIAIMIITLYGMHMHVNAVS